MSRLSSSQPELPRQNQKSQVESLTPSGEDLGPVISFSQPLHPDHMLLSSQFQGTPGSSQTPMQKLVRRMTRFFVKTDKNDTLKEIDRVFDLLGYTYKRSSPGVVGVYFCLI